MQQHPKEQQQSDSDTPTNTENKTIAAPENLEDVRTPLEETRERAFLSEMVKGEAVEVKLVYRYLDKCQNASLSELIEKVALRRRQVKYALCRLRQLDCIVKIDESESQRYAISE